MDDETILSYGTTITVCSIFVLVYNFRFLVFSFLTSFAFVLLVSSCSDVVETVTSD